MTVKKFIGWTLAIFIIWFMVTSPSSASAAFNNAKSGIENAFTSLAQVAGSVTGTGSGG